MNTNFIKSYTRNMQLKRFLFILVLLLHVLVFIKIDLGSFLLGKVQLWDFDVYHQTAVDVRGGQHPYKLPYMQTAGPPLVIAPFIPFSFLPLSVARGIMISLSLIAVFATAYNLAGLTTSKHKLLLTTYLNLLLLCLFQPRFNITLGQPNLILMYLVTVVMTTSNSILKGILLGCFTIIKTHYIFTLLTLRSNFKTIFITLMTVLIVCIISLPIIKFRFYTDYIFGRIGEHLTVSHTPTDLDYYNQSSRVSFSRIGMPSLYVLFSVVLLIGGSSYLFWSKDLGSSFLISLLLSPVVWQHYMVVTYPILFMTALAYFKKRKFPIQLALAAFLLCAHLPWLHQQPYTILGGIVASHYFWGVVLLLYTRVTLFLNSEKKPIIFTSLLRKGVAVR